MPPSTDAIGNCSSICRRHFSIPANPRWAGAVWFLREFDPALSSDPATIYANGIAIGESWPGTAISVYVAPGTYTFKVPNDFPDGQQAPTVELTAGAQVYFNIDANDWVDAGDQEEGRGTFDLGQMPVSLADEFFSALTVRPHN